MVGLHSWMEIRYGLSKMSAFDREALEAERLHVAAQAQFQQQKYREAAATWQAALAVAARIGAVPLKRRVQSTLVGALEDLVDALIDRGFCCCVSKYDESVYGRATKNTALPAMRPKPLALKVAVTAKHEPATVDALVAAIVDAAGP